MSSRPGGVEVRRLTRDEIVEAALVHLRDSDLDSLTVRKLALDLQVSPMALYRHVASKDDILLAIVDAMLARQQLRLPREPKAALTAVARSLRKLLTEHPALVRVYNRQPVASPAAVARLEATVEVLMRRGWTRHRAVQAYAAVHTYTLGFCTLEAARDHSVPTDGVGAEPTGSAIRGFVSGAQFKHGLDALIVGLDPSPTA